MEVLLRVRGRLAALDTPIFIHDLSRTGFALISGIEFREGETLDFKIEGADDTPIAVTAQAVHCRSISTVHGLHLCGFRFVPGRLTGVVPQLLIDRLIETVSGPPVPCF